MAGMGNFFDSVGEFLSRVLDWLRMGRGRKEEVQTLFTRTKF
jgi:hypothetical protein